jgi:hypothetical protein
MVGVVGLGAWQVSLTSSGGFQRIQEADVKLIHLRSFFKRKYLID